MNSQRQSKKRQSNSHEANNKNFYALKVTGYGYVNYLEERRSEHGVFTACRIAALIGDAEQQPKQYRYFNVIASDAVAELLWKFEQDMADERNVFIEFCLNDVKPKAYKKQDGELGAVNASYLIGIQRLWIDGELLFNASSEHSNSQKPKSLRSKETAKQSSRQNAPASRGEQVSNRRYTGNRSYSQSAHQY